ncbi:ferric reductase like transmembrane component-domain-containing protein [Immersiella caudata]|uniref:Ferric reductase like transmembrane component-domain-containing protein n=1 Tax=Immersiella caudata TaxID=314043 RepID=A0AA39WJU3_9PEZI|nr:ferric reductase like transmembrane component-domain-containing protein [Immersiella caudata]
MMSRKTSPSLPAHPSSNPSSQEPLQAPQVPLLWLNQPPTMAMTPLHYAFRPIVSDQHTAARAYFLCVIAMLFLESLAQLSPYLPGFIKRKRQPDHSLPRVFFHKLTTLPSAIPFLTNHTLPTLLRCLVFTALNLLWGWNRIRYSTDYQIYGWLTIANGGLALLLPTRTNVFSLLARIPAPTLLNYHRWAGIATVVHATLHFGLTAQQYVRTKQFDTVLQNTRIRIGVMAWAALAVMLLSSLRVVRRRAYEVFAYLHFAFLVFLGGALYHATHGYEFLLPGLILWVLDRAVRCYFCFFRRDEVKVTDVTHYAGNVTKIRLEGTKTRAAGQMAWVRIPGVSVVNWHPFTIASAPGRRGGTLAIRGLGGYTKKVQRLGEGDKEGHGRPHMRISLDGPYGVEALPWAKFPVVVLIAGGIGITPAMSIASYLVDQGVSNKLAGVGERHAHLLWCIRDISHACWFEEELKALAALALPTTLSLAISIYVTGGGASMVREEDALGAGTVYNGPGEVHRGRPDMGQWFRHLKEVRPGVDVAVNLCGPQLLVDDARRAAADASGKTGLFHVQEEVFEF